MKEIPKRAQKILREILHGIGTPIQTRPGKRVLSDTISLFQIIEWFRQKCVVFPEEYQRWLVASWRKFGRQWVTALFNNTSFRHFDKIHIWMQGGDILGMVMKAIVEGQQRLRMIALFFLASKENNFTLGDCTVVYNGVTLYLTGMTWSDLEEAAKYDANLNSFLQSVLQRVFDASIYENHTIEEISEIFRAINNKEALNAQELRTSMGGEACIAIRKTARQNADPKSNPEEHLRFPLHPIFELIKGISKMKGRWLGIAVDRFSFEKFLAEQCHFEDCFGNKDFAITPETLDAMYRKYREKGSFVKLLNVVKGRLTIMYKMVYKDNVVSNEKLLSKNGILFLVYGLLYHFEKVWFKGCEVTYPNPHLAYVWIMKKHFEMVHTKEISLNGKKVISDYGLKVRRASRVQKELDVIFGHWTLIIKGGTKKEKDANGNLIDITVPPVSLQELAKNGINVKDGRRTVSDVEALEAYVNQGGKDAATGEVTPLTGLVKGHKTAHHKGLANDAVTTVENTVMVNKLSNQILGGQDFVEEKK